MKSSGVNGGSQRRTRHGQRGVVHITLAILILAVIIAFVVGGWFAFNVWPDAPSHPATYAYTGGSPTPSGSTFYQYAVTGGSTPLMGTTVTLLGSASPFYLGVMSGGASLCTASYGPGGGVANVPASCTIASGDTLIVDIPSTGTGATGVSIGGTVLGFGTVGPAEKGGPIGCGYYPGC